ncbi:MAG: hypothetical protein K0M73_12360 [Hydrogenophaga sp.]|nr:hypothetical protein [Hydrogenophaga sp.]
MKKMRLSDNQLAVLRRDKWLRAIRNCSLCLGCLALATAFSAMSNTVGNPKTWSSAFNALAASGALVGYAGLLAGAGGLLLLVGIVAAVLHESQ